MVFTERVPKGKTEDALFSINPESPYRHNVPAAPAIASPSSLYIMMITPAFFSNGTTMVHARYVPDNFQLLYLP